MDILGQGIRGLYKQFRQILNGKFTHAQIMAWRHQATNHCLYFFQIYNDNNNNNNNNNNSLYCRLPGVMHNKWIPFKMNEWSKKIISSFRLPERAIVILCGRLHMFNINIILIVSSEYLVSSQFSWQFSQHPPFNIHLPHIDDGWGPSHLIHLYIYNLYHLAICQCSPKSISPKGCTWAQWVNLIFSTASVDSRKAFVPKFMQRKWWTISPFLMTYLRCMFVLHVKLSN